MNKVVFNRWTDLNFSSKRKKEKQKMEFWFNSTYIILLSVIWFLLIYYVWILNANATKWYDIRQLEERQVELLLEQERLETKIADLDSLHNILSEEWKDNMEKVEDPDYLVIKEGDDWYAYNDE